jgi:hypothetical protein
MTKYRITTNGRSCRVEERIFLCGWSIIKGGLTLTEAHEMVARYQGYDEDDRARRKAKWVVVK